MIVLHAEQSFTDIIVNTNECHLQVMGTVVGAVPGNLQQQCGRREGHGKGMVNSSAIIKRLKWNLDPPLMTQGLDEPEPHTSHL